ncbi:MAG: Mur ligase family protein [Candidatus Moranbacteria bacterium]|nr:Mur ligase family protein [Candidatus Moranbacteria bacterium]
MKSILKKIVQFHLKLFTKITLWRHRPFIVAVAGSTNKTTTKDYILKFLREKFPPTGEAGGEEEVRGNPKSYNTEIGLPLAILYLDSGESSALRWLKILIQAKMRALFGRKFPKKLVLELGVEEKGDMEYLLGMVRPNVAVVTNIEGSYTYSNSSLEKIFEEMKLLAKKIPEKGYLLLNSDDERVKDLAKHAKAKVITFGFAADADARAENLKTDAQGQTFDFVFQNKKESVRIKKYGRTNIYAWMAAKVVKNIL